MKITKQCVICKKEFKTRNEKRKCCSHSCSQIHEDEQKRRIRKENARHWLKIKKIYYVTHKEKIKRYMHNYYLKRKAQNEQTRN